MLPAEWPDRLPGYAWVPSYWGARDLRFAPEFADPPELLVVHSGSVGAWVAEYLSDPIAETPRSTEIFKTDSKRATNGRRLCDDGFWRRVAAAHFCWYYGVESKLYPTLRLGQSEGPPPKVHGFVQTASLRREVPGAGGSVCMGRKKWVNAHALHLELPGPALGLTRSDYQLSCWRVLLRNLRDSEALPRLWTRHSDIDLGKRDPGPGFLVEWMDGFGTKWVGRERSR